MSKKKIALVSVSLLLFGIAVVLILRFFAGGSGDRWICENDQWVKHGNPSVPSPTEGCGPKPIGGDKDEGGCLVGAGYSWCEVKQKCVRVWEEPCVVSNIYTNLDMKFSLEIPTTWEGYKATSDASEVFKSLSFSFSDPHRPFTIFQILKTSKERWEAAVKIPSFKVLEENENEVYVCDGCCFSDGDFTGGGQFDEFQIARCKEVPKIVETFKLEN